MEMHLTPLTLELLPSASRPPPVLGPAMGQTAQERMEENPCADCSDCLPHRQELLKLLEKWVVCFPARKERG